MIEPIDINKELPNFPQEIVTEKEILDKQKDGFVLIRNSPKGQIWYKLPDHKFEDEDNEEEDGE